VITTGEIIAAFGVLTGAIGFGFGLYQYNTAQKWKKSEFAAKLLAELADDERLSLCCKLLDYSMRKFSIPTQYRPLTQESIFLHNWEAMAEAMSPEAKRGEFDWQAILYRDLFDYFFGYLERINHYINIGLITVKDVSSIDYWLRQIASPRFVKTSIFTDYLQAYDYSGVLELMNKFGIKHIQQE
jgi:hypothetical protein